MHSIKELKLWVRLYQNSICVTVVWNMYIQKTLSFLHNVLFFSAPS